MYGGDRPGVSLALHADGTLQVGCGHAIFASQGRVQDGKWHHIALVLRAGAVELYLDGTRDELREKRAGSAIPTGSVSRAMVALGCGYWPDSGFTAVRGRITEFRVWKVARTPAEVRRTMRVQSLRLTTEAQATCTALWSEHRTRLPSGTEVPWVHVGRWRPERAKSGDDVPRFTTGTSGPAGHRGVAFVPSHAVQSAARHDIDDFPVLWAVNYMGSGAATSSSLSRRGLGNDKVSVVEVGSCGLRSVDGAGAFVSVSRRHTELLTPTGKSYRGVTLVVLNHNGSVRSTKTFDTFGDKGQAWQAAAAYANREAAPADGDSLGSVIIAAVQDAVGKHADGYDDQLRRTIGTYTQLAHPDATSNGAGRLSYVGVGTVPFAGPEHSCVDLLDGDPATPQSLVICVPFLYNLAGTRDAARAASSAEVVVPGPGAHIGGHGGRRGTGTAPACSAVCLDAGRCGSGFPGSFPVTFRGECRVGLARTVAEAHFIMSRLPPLRHVITVTADDHADPQLVGRYFHFFSDDVPGLERDQTRLARLRCEGKRVPGGVAPEFTAVLWGGPNRSLRSSDQGDCHGRTALGCRCPILNGFRVGDLYQVLELSPVGEEDALLEAHPHFKA